MIMCCPYPFYRGIFKKPNGKLHIRTPHEEDRIRFDFFNSFQKENLLADPQGWTKRGKSFLWESPNY
jgi:hypothetical protein